MRLWLKQIRLGHGLDVEGISSSAGISRQYYNMIENGTRNPSVGLAKALGVLLGFEWTRFYEKGECETRALENGVEEVDHALHETSHL